MADWRTALGVSDLTREEFLRLCEVALRQLFPEMLVEAGKCAGQLHIKLAGEKPLTIYLDNLWSNCRRDPENRANEVERFLRIIATSDTDSDKELDKRSIVATIKDEGYLRISRQEDGSGPAFVHEHLVGDIWIVYAIDTPERILSLLKSSFEKLDLDLKDLRSLAVENLKCILPPIEQHGEGPLYMLTAGGDYVASLILFDELWNDLEATVDGEIVAAVPTRDVLLFTSSRSAEGICAMRERITALTETGGYLVSTSMLLRRSGRWIVFS
jgi:uncharacterized protein YtpQ (UPF0354 family)